MVGAPGAIECALRSNGIACREAKGSGSVVVERLGREHALLLELIRRLAGGTLRQGELSAADGCLLALGQFRGAVIGEVSQLYRNRVRSPGNLRDIELAGLDLPLLVVIGPLQDRATPFTHQPVGDALDSELRPFALCVEEDNLADSAAQQAVLVDW